MSDTIQALPARRRGGGPGEDDGKSSVTDPIRTTHLVALVAAAALFSGFLLYLVAGLHFEMLRSDVATYWSYSLQWRTPFSVWWVPGYPLLLALVHWITQGVLGPLSVMLLVTGFWYLVAVSTVFSIVRGYDRSGPEAPFWFSLLFAAFPFVGLTYSAYPISDTMAIALTLLSVSSMERKRWLALAVFAGFGLVAHKATWFLLPPLLAVAFVQNRAARPFLLLAPVPVLAWIAGGVAHFGDPLWFMRWSVEHLAVSRSQLPVLDGIVGPFLAGSPTKAAKGLIVLAVTVGALVGAYRSFRQRYWPGVILCGGLVAMAVALNQYEIWAVVRFSRLLIVPLAYLVVREHPDVLSRRRGVVPRAAFALCVLSNLLYGYYMAVMFFH